MRDYFRSQALGANKRIRTRGLLLDSAIELFSEKGIEEASIHEITASAGLANGTFYNHFKDKDDLALASSAAIAFEIAQKLDAQMVDIDRGVARVVVASWAFMRFAMTAKSWAMVLVDQYQRKPSAEVSAFDYMRKDIELAREQHTVEIEVDDFLLEQIAALMMASLRSMIRISPAERIYQRTCENILRLLGLTPTQAKREVEKASRHALLTTSLDF